MRRLDNEVEMDKPPKASPRRASAVPIAWKYCVELDVADSITGATSKNDPITAAATTIPAHAFTMFFLLNG